MVAVLMMQPVDSDPACGAVLQIAHAEDRERVLEPFGASKSAVSQQAVVADRDAEHSEGEVAEYRKDQARPCEEVAEGPGKERECRDQVHAGDHNCIRPNDPHRLGRFRVIQTPRRGVVWLYRSRNEIRGMRIDSFRG